MKKRISPIRDHDALCLCEHSTESFYGLIDAIRALGYDEATAGRYAVLIGDTPCKDNDGKIIVQDCDGQVLAQLDLDYFD
jgi:hypothetical protein